MNQKEAGVAILIADKADFRTNKIIKDKEGNYIKKCQFFKKA